MARTVTLPLEGGCQCGALRYRLSAAPLMLYCCHCTNCQRITGSAFVISATVPEAAFEFTAGEPKTTEWKSDAGNTRYGHFCGDCGTRIAHGQKPAIGFLSLRAGTFDDTSWLKPSGHIWTASAQPWTKALFGEDDILSEGQPADYAPFVERFRRDVAFA